jgi:hypothetical protein
MLILSLAALLVGAVLGMRFKVLILLPAIVASFLVIGAVGIGSSTGLGFVALAAIVAATCLQLGYLIGVALRHAVGLARASLIQRVGHSRAASLH